MVQFCTYLAEEIDVKDENALQVMLQSLVDMLTMSSSFLNAVWYKLAFPSSTLLFY